MTEGVHFFSAKLVNEFGEFPLNFNRLRFYNKIRKRAETVNDWKMYTFGFTHSPAECVFLIEFLFKHMNL